MVAGRQSADELRRLDEHAHFVAVVLPLDGCAVRRRPDDAAQDFIVESDFTLGHRFTPSSSWSAGVPPALLSPGARGTPALLTSPPAPARSPRCRCATLRRGRV